MNSSILHDTMHSIRWLTLCLCGVAALSSADTLYLRAGEQAEGRLKSMDAGAVVFEGRDGAKSVKPEDVTRIQLQRVRTFDDIDTADKITDPDLRACIAVQPSDKDYPADGDVTLLQRRTFDLTTPGVIKEMTRTITKILRQRGENAASTNAWYFDDTDAPEIDFALTVTPDGRVLHLSDAALKSESVYSRLPDYRRLSRLRFACKEPNPGSILDVQFTVLRKRDTLLEPFYAEETFRYDSPVLRKEIVVVTAPGQSFCYGLNAACNGNINYADQKDGSLVRHVWTLKQPMPGIVQEPLMPPRNTFVPVLTLGVEASWDDVARAYRKVLDELPPLSDPLRAKAVELAKKGGAGAVYNFIAKTIRTAPVAQHEYRFQPYPPDKSAARGLANELDKNILYYAMLEAAGIDCAFALVRDRGQGPLAEGIASLRAFHRSAVYLAKNKIFSTTVSDRLSFDAFPCDLQGAKALVLFDKGAKTMDTPVAKPVSESDATRFDARLREDGELDLTVTYTATGNAQATMRTFKDLDEEQLRHQLEEVAGRLHPAALLKNFKTSDLADLDVPPSITIACTIPGYATKAGNDLMLFNLPAVDYSAGDVGRPTREHALFWSHTARARVTGVIELPKGFAVYGRPDNVRVKSGAVAYNAKFRVHKGALEFEDAFDIKTLMAPAIAYPDYKRAQETRAGFARQRIILKKEIK